MIKVHVGNALAKFDTSKSKKRTIRKLNRILDRVAAVRDPKLTRTAAFKRNAIDGYRRFHLNGIIPVGFLDNVFARLDRAGIKYDAPPQAKLKQIPFSKIDADCCNEIELIDAQRGAVAACLSNTMGRVRLPTSTGKTAALAATALYYFQKKGWRTLVVTSGAGLAPQNADAFEKFVGDAMSVGLYSGQTKRFGDLVSATAQSFTGKIEPGFFASMVKGVDTRKTARKLTPEIKKLLEYEVLIFDEGHHGASPLWSGIAQASKAQRRFGFSGTTETRDPVRDALLQAVVGKVIYRVSAKEMVEVGRIRPPLIISSGYGKVRDGKQMRRAQDYKKIHDEQLVLHLGYNKYIADVVKELVAVGRKPLIVCPKLPQMRIISRLLKKRGVRVGVVSGSVVGEYRKVIKRELTDGDIDVIVASTVFDEGEDAPAIDAIVIADGEKSAVRAVQRPGRTTRKGTSSESWVVDLHPRMHKIFVKHADIRVAIYRREEYDVRVVDKQLRPKKLIAMFVKWTKNYARDREKSS